MSMRLGTSKTCLVTGGAGFLGSHLCEKLLAQGHEVICLDNLFTGSRRNIEHLLDQTLPAEARQWLGLLGVRVVINLHGELVRVEMPAAPEDEE